MAKKEYQSPLAKLCVFTDQDVVRTSNVSVKDYERDGSKHTVGGFDVDWLNR